MNGLIINNREVRFEQQGEHIFCTSLDIAAVFEKRHADVLRAIESILSDLREIGDMQCERNFAESYEYRKIEGFKGLAKYPYYKLTRDGFSLLAMGFTGRKALQWKIAFLNAFNQMEQALKEKHSHHPTGYLVVHPRFFGLKITPKASQILMKFLEKCTPTGELLLSSACRKLIAKDCYTSVPYINNTLHRFVKLGVFIKHPTGYQLNTQLISAHHSNASNSNDITLQHLINTNTLLEKYNACLKQHCRHYLIIIEGYQARVEEWMQWIERGDWK